MVEELVDGDGPDLLVVLGQPTLAEKLGVDQRHGAPTQRGFDVSDLLVVVAKLLQGRFQHPHPLAEGYDDSLAGLQPDQEAVEFRGS